MPIVKFIQKYKWAILPTKNKISIKDIKEKTKIYSEEFRWIRTSRSKELCWSWRLAQEIGWDIVSPIDVEMKPLDDIQITNDLTEIKSLNDFISNSHVWRRDKEAIVMPKQSWVNLYQYKSKENWESIFIPNGDGSVEWHLGFNIRIPKLTYLLVLPFHRKTGLDVEMGILDKKSLDKMNSVSSMSIVIRPNCKIKIQRGDKIAKLILLGADVLNALAENQMN